MYTNVNICLFWEIVGDSGFVGTFGHQQICHNAQIGISIEPEINAQLQVPATTVSTDLQSFCNITLDILYKCDFIFKGRKLLHDIRAKDVGKLCQFCH